MRLAPAPGLKVRDPRTHAWIPTEGVEVGEHDFDLWKMKDQGDLVEAPDLEPEKVAAPETDPPAAPPAPPAYAPAAPIAPAAESAQTEEGAR